MRTGEVAIMARNILRTEISKGQSLQPVLPCHAVILSCSPVAEQTGVGGGWDNRFWVALSGLGYKGVLQSIMQLQSI